MDEDEYTRITLRIPKKLHRKLAEEAKSSSKSMNAEIIARLTQSFHVSVGFLQPEKAQTEVIQDYLSRLSEHLNVQGELNHKYQRLFYLKNKSEVTPEDADELRVLEYEIEKLEEKYLATSVVKP